jgi:hypothetical protein
MWSGPGRLTNLAEGICSAIHLLSAAELSLRFRTSVGTAMAGKTWRMSVA